MHKEIFEIQCSPTSMADHCQKPPLAPSTLPRLTSEQLPADTLNQFRDNVIYFPPHPSFIIEIIFTPADLFRKNQSELLSVAIKLFRFKLYFCCSHLPTQTYINTSHVYFLWDAVLCWSVASLAQTRLLATCSSQEGQGMDMCFHLLPPHQGVRQNRCFCGSLKRWVELS
ncbi:hypothetical protein NPIL_461681 [Nephila pilipes]|uniref:Uncharacterized protein n=1 Tax=Nephila pilipes TaxID=299642 RepID=A0A8X6IVP9_NEPPI|nr:hypothetical protein NPIL_461681 [Nephila pilipes]